MDESTTGGIDYAERNRNLEFEDGLISASEYCTTIAIVDDDIFIVPLTLC